MTGYKIGMAEEAVIADLTAKLAESQAREAKLREALRDRGGWDELDEIPTDDTALKEYRKKVLLDAADFASSQGDLDFVVWQLRRMAEE